MAEKRKSYHTFKRRDEEGNVFELTCLVEKAPCPVGLDVLERHILEALRRGGQADGQNCAGAVCVTKSQSRFKHPVSYLTDWWRNRLYIYTGTKNKIPRCVVYAHYDNIEALFDGDEAGLTRLLKRVRKNGSISVSLFPVIKGRHSKTGKKTHPSGPRPSGKHRPPRGAELREMNYLKARGTLPIPGLLPTQ